MSFSVSTGTVAIGEVAEAVAAKLAETGSQERAGQLGELAAEIAGQVAATLAAEDDKVVVSIGGHWNGGTDPVSGWASNALTVSVTQVYAPAEG